MWDGKEFYLRTGRAQRNIPELFKRGLPDIQLDGELWLGNGRFNEVSSLLFRTTAIEKKTDTWKEVKFIVFDLPDDLPYEKRLDISLICRKVGPCL